MTRLRDLGITIGFWPTGPHNAITDVPGVLVGHTTIIADTPRVARTGVTVVVPRNGDIWRNGVFAGYHSFNGCGEMTGMHWVAESGILGGPIAITGTASVGAVYEAITAYGYERGHGDAFLPVVAETFDGFLSDLAALHVRSEHVFAALDGAQSGPVAEGNVGGGTGMICHAFKGGIGTASRMAETRSGVFTVGALVQANYGRRRDFRIDGVPVGKLLDPALAPIPWEQPPSTPGSSIIIIVATDAPLLPHQCNRLAQRAAAGLARVGGMGHNGSGDLFLAFASGNELPNQAAQPYPLRMLPNEQIDPLFDATVEAVEEAILNAVVAAETMRGFHGRTVHALPHEAVQNLMKRDR
jgi:D-aminopeptidase